MSAPNDLEERLSSGERLWHWLHDQQDWDEFQLYFISLHRTTSGVLAGLWDVRDQGTGTEDPVIFGPSDPECRPGQPTQWVPFSSVADALAGLGAHGVSAEGFGSHSELVASYGRARNARSPWTHRHMPTAVKLTEPDAKDP